MRKTDERKQCLAVIAVLALLASVLMIPAGCSTLAQITGGGSPEDIFTAAEADLFGAGNQVYSIIEVALPRHSGYQPLDDKTAYEQLETDDQREAYASIEQSLFCVTNEAGGTYGRYCLKRAEIPNLTSGEIFMVKEAVLADHPEAFWVNSVYSLGYNMHDGYYLIMYTNFDYSSICARVKAVEQSMESILKEIPSNASEYDRELLIHDRLVHDTEYDVDSVEIADSNYVEASTIYGTLVNKKALCVGYSYAAKLLLNRVGISCSTVKGISKDVGHMWNIVRIDNDWYHLDVTWDDPITISADNVQKYDYFNITDAQICVDHEISDDYSQLTDEYIAEMDGSSMNFFNFIMEPCTATEANYYERNALKLDGMNDAAIQQIADRMKRMSYEGDTAMYLLIGGEQTGAADWLSISLVTAMTEANRAAKQSSSRRISQCLLGSREESTSAWSNVYCIKLVFEEQAE